MSRRISFTASAAADIAAAFFWYEVRRKGLGDRFVTAVQVVAERLADHPFAGPIVLGDIRRVLLPTFPYALYYRLSDSTIEIRGCLHHRRRPRPWRRPT